MTMKKITKFVNDRISLIVGIGLIISVHWGWYKLQQVPHFVSESERKSLPFVRLTDFLQKKLSHSFGSLSDSTPADEAVAKTK